MPMAQVVTSIDTGSSDASGQLKSVLHSLT